MNLTELGFSSFQSKQLDIDVNNFNIGRVITVNKESYKRKNPDPQDTSACTAKYRKSVGRVE